MTTFNVPVRWMLSWFDRDTSSFVGEIELAVRDEGEIREALALEADCPLTDELPIGASRREAVERLSGRPLDLGRYEYFVGAVSA